MGSVTFPSDDGMYNCPRARCSLQFVVRAHFGKVG